MQQNLKTMCFQHQEALDSLSTKDSLLEDAPMEPSVDIVDEEDDSLDLTVPVFDPRMDKVGKEAPITRQYKSVGATSKPDSGKTKILRPIQEEDCSEDSICRATYKNTFKRCHKALRVMSIDKANKKGFLISLSLLKEATQSIDN